MVGDWELRVVEMDKRRIVKVVADRSSGPSRPAVDRRGGSASTVGPEDRRPESTADHRPGPASGLTTLGLGWRSRRPLGR